MPELSLHFPFGSAISHTCERQHQLLCKLHDPALYCFQTYGLTLVVTPRRPSLISVVGFLDSVVAAKQNSVRFGYPISPNRELVALGAGNLVGSFVPGILPAYGSITR
jgi:hypothetical protein